MAETMTIPFAAHCQIRDEPAVSGASRLSIDVAPPLTNTRGQAHGGVLMTMLDIALGRAARDRTPGATSFMTIDMQIAFLAPGSGRLIAEGRVTGGGRSLVFCEGDVRDAAGEIIARASGLFRPIVPDAPT